jgi:signal recognition particle receptor subunit beta
MLDHAMRGACLLVYANKSDLPHALSAEEVRDALQIDQIQPRAWHVQPAAAIKGDGVWQGFRWLVANVKPI